MRRLISLRAIGSTSANHRGLGDYFRSCLIADIESLAYYGGIHEVEHGFHRALSKRFPFCIYYSVNADVLIVVAVLDARRDPLWIRQRLE